jgi:hypothetical protein
MSDERFEFDFNRITYREVLELQIDDDGEKVDEEQATDETIELIARVLVKWPHSEDPTVDYIKDLGLQDFADLQLAFSTAMENVFKKSD